MKQTLWNKKLWPNITLAEYLAVLLFYIFMAASYGITLSLNNTESRKNGAPLIQFTELGPQFLDYGLKLIVTIPIWLLIFRVMMNRPLWERLCIHLLTLPFFVFTWKALYYAACEKFGIGHLYGRAEVWDVYIPGLVYVLQFVLFHLYDYYLALKKHEQLSVELKTMALQNEMKALHAQVQPHFLFNTLNSISASVPAHLEHTRELISRLADTFRFSLDASRHETISLRKDLAFIRAYLDLERERFSDRLQVVYDIDESLLDVEVPPMLLQPLVENALRHGISKSVDGGKLMLSVQPAGNNIRICVTDTGAGLNGVSPAAALRKGTGLGNTHQRLMKLYGQPVIIEPVHPTGARVFFELPKKQA